MIWLKVQDSRLWRKQVPAHASPTPALPEPGLPPSIILCQRSHGHGQMPARRAPAHTRASPRPTQLHHRALQPRCLPKGRGETQKPQRLCVQRCCLVFDNSLFPFKGRDGIGKAPSMSPLMPRSQPPSTAPTPSFRTWITLTY